MHSSRFSPLALSTMALLLPLLAACGGSSEGDPGLQITGAPSSGELGIGQSVDLDIHFTDDAGASRGVIWSSSDPSVATVDADGVVTGVSAGTVTISATDADDPSKVATVTFTVNPDLAPVRDTSGYEGKLSWSLDALLAMPSLRVWDLPSSRYVTRLDSPEDAINSYLFPATSQDGSTLVHTFTSGTITSSDFVLEVARVDLATGATTRVPRDTGTPGQRRFSQQASVSGDGSVVAFSQFMASYNPDYVPDSQTDAEIALSVDGGTPRALTAHAAADTCPSITADAQSVIFMSDRDLGDGDFYRVATTEGATVERLSYTGHPDITGLAKGYRKGCAFDVSDDGSRIAFLGNTAEGVAVFVMNTATLVIEQVSTKSAHGTATASSLSGDGTRVVFITSAKVAEGTPEEETFLRLYAAELGAPASLVLENTFLDVTKHNALLTTSATSLALSRDGGAIATILSNRDTEHDDELFIKLVVMRFDGSDIRTVSAEEDDVSLYGASGLTF